MSIRGNQPQLSKFLRISGSNSLRITLCSAHTDLQIQSFSQFSWCFSILNLSLSKIGVEEEEVFLFALVFLTMMLRIRIKGKQKQRKKHKGRLHQRGLSTKISINNNLYDTCNECTYDTCYNALKFVQFYFINHQLT